MLTGLDGSGVLPNAPGGLVQRLMLVTAFGWVALVAARLVVTGPASGPRRR